LLKEKVHRKQKETMKKERKKLLEKVMMRMHQIMRPRIGKYTAQHCLTRLIIDKNLQIKNDVFLS
jgi:hypothetical protein